MGVHGAVALILLRLLILKKASFLECWVRKEETEKNPNNVNHKTQAQGLSSADSTVYLGFLKLFTDSENLLTRGQRCGLSSHCHVQQEETTETLRTGAQQDSGPELRA